MNILDCFLTNVRDGIHNIVQGRFLVPEEVAPHEPQPVKNIILDVVFYGGAMFAPIYYCILREFLRQTYYCQNVACFLHNVLFLVNLFVSWRMG